jgi:hypothetical protein
MGVDLILIGIAFVVGVIGTLWKDPPKLAKFALIGLLILSSVAAIWKSYSDDKDKELLQNLAVAGLALPNSAYDVVYEQMGKAYSNSATVNCHHTNDGMTCPLQPTAGQAPQALVFNRYELARVYADAVRGRDTGAFLKEIATHRYDPEHLSDDYEDKLGILGFHTFYDMCQFFPRDYNYDDSFGIKVIYDDKGERREISISSDEMKAPAANTGPVLFGQFDKLWREKIHLAIPTCK